MFKKNNKGIAQFGLLLVLALIAVGGIAYYSNDFSLSILGGGTVLSVDQAQFTSKNPDLNFQDAYLIDVVINGGGEKIIGEITPAQIKAYGITKIPEGPFRVELSLKDVSCDYDLIDDNTVLYKVYQSTAWENCLRNNPPTGSVNLQTTVNNCRLGDNRILVPLGGRPAPDSPPAGGDCSSMTELGEWSYWMPEWRNTNTCEGQGDWRTTNSGGIPWFRGYRISTETNVDYVIDITLVNSKNESITSTLTPKQSVSFMADIGRAKFVGNLLANKFCPVPSVEKSVVKNLANNDFKVVSKVNYDAYKQRYLELINMDVDRFLYQWQQVRVDPGVGGGPIWDRMSSMNTFLRAMNDEELSDDCKIIQDGGGYSCVPTGQVIYPELQLLIRADWIGVTIPSGQPRIDFAVIDDLAYENDLGTIRVRLNNQGSDMDSFDVGLSCSPVDLDFGTQRITLDPLEADELVLKYSGSTGNYTCQVLARSVNNPLATDSKELLINILDKPLDSPKPFNILPEINQLIAQNFWLMVGLVVVLMVVLVIAFFYVPVPFNYVVMSGCGVMILYLLWRLFF